MEEKWRSGEEEGEEEETEKEVLRLYCMYCIGVKEK